MSVLAEERKKVILELLERDGKVTVISLAKQMGVSAETIRRDLDSLEEEGKLRRVYGGAVKIACGHGEPPYSHRQRLYQKEKRAIGRKAAALIEDGETLVIDVGTTPLELARAIQGRRGLTILTNSFPVATVLTESLNAEKFSGKLIFLGGDVNPLQQSVYGPFCEQMMRQFHVDKAFLSVGGVSLTRGISDYDLQEAAMSRTMAECARQVIVLADHSKIGVQAFVTVLPLDAVDVIVCDHPFPKEWKRVLEEKNVLWLVASGEAKENHEAKGANRGK